VEGADQPSRGQSNLDKRHHDPDQPYSRLLSRPSLSPLNSPSGRIPSQRDERSPHSPPESVWSHGSGSRERVSGPMPPSCQAGRRRRNRRSRQVGRCKLHLEFSLWRMRAGEFSSPWPHGGHNLKGAFVRKTAGLQVCPVGCPYTDRNAVVCPKGCGGSTPSSRTNVESPRGQPAIMRPAIQMMVFLSRSRGSWREWRVKANGHQGQSGGLVEGGCTSATALRRHSAREARGQRGGGGSKDHRAVHH